MNAGNIDSPFRRDRLTWLAYGMLGLYNYLLSGLGPLMASLRDELSLSYTVTSLHFSAFAAGMILAGLIGDRLVARWGRRAIFWTGAAGLLAGAVSLALVRDPLLTIASVFLMGSVGSLALVLIPAILSDRHGPRRAIAIVEANILSAATGALAALTIGAGEQTPFGWRGALLLSLIVPLVLIVRFRSVPIPAPALPASGSRVFAARLPAAYWAYWVTIVLAVGVEFCLIFWGADFLVAAGLSTAAAATTVSLFLWGMVAGRLTGRQIALRFTPEQLLPMTLMLALAGFLLYWLAPVAALTVIGLFVAGFGVANLFPLTSAMALAAAPGHSTQAAARLSFASGLAILAAPLLLGALADAIGIRVAYGVAPLFLIGAFVGSQVGKRLSGRVGG